MASNNSNLNVIINGQSKPLVEAADQAIVALEKLVNTSNVSFDDLKIVSENMSLSASASLQRLYDQGKITADGMKAAGLEISSSMKESATQSALSFKGLTAAFEADTVKMQSSMVPRFKNTTDNISKNSKEGGEGIKILGKGFLESAASFATGMAEFTAFQVIISKISDVVKAGASSYVEYQKQVSAINAALKTTNDASGQTEAGLEKLAETQERSTGISKNATLAVEAQLLNFKNITGDMFPKVVKQVEDTAAAMDHGVPSASRLASAAQMLGKAYERPNNIQQALGRSLGDLSQEQINAIKSHYNLTTAVGKTASAILDEASISRNTARTMSKDNEEISKKTQALQAAKANLAKVESEQYIDESYRQAAIAKAQDKISAATRSLSDTQSKQSNDQVNASDRLAKAQARLNTSHKDANDLLGAQALIYDDLNGLVGGRAVAAADTLAGKEAMLVSRFQDISNAAISKIGDTFNKVIMPAFVNLGNTILDFVTSDQFQGWLGNVGQLLADVWGFITTKIWPAIEDFGRAIGNFVASDQFQSYLRILGGLLGDLWKTISTQLAPALVNFWHKVIEPLLPVLGTLAGVAILGVIAALDALFKIITPVINFIADHKQLVIDFGAAFLGLAIALKFEKAVNDFKSGMDTVMGKIGSVQGKVTDLFNKISGGTVMGGVATGLAMADIALVMQAVQNVIGAINDMNNMTSSAKADAQSMQDAITKIQAAIKAGKVSPSKGNKMIQGIRQGLNSANAVSSMSLWDAIKETAGFASGVENFAGGLAIVGEEGPELVHLPAGSSVTSADKTANMMNGGIAGAASVTLNVHVGSYMGSTADRQKLATQLWQELQRIERQHGMGGSLPNIGVLPV